ncbi:uncharacterized protein si:dkeyp-38g8.5 [Plectropomus leopardus]|uniref:uncharacterized protein si:dkeyp-38g8.5 n=1 Tax=Plectropomus leopardus TaxID=160734 RepID=UPI001C4B6723|nr:uncharacterized protein si:dkeyp-38g8.5 [Plectropomus leopardus]
MDFEDHAYTSTTYDKVSPVEFTYKMSASEIKEFVKLRVSNNYLFSGKRNTSMCAWRAILKHMGLQHKMTHIQASKKWENMKKRYKDLKNPPEWDEAQEEEGVHGDKLPWPSLAGGPEVEISLNEDEDEEEGQEIGRTTVMEREKQVMERERLVIQRERAVLDREVAALDRDRAPLERERAMLERERAVMERERAVMEKDKEAVNRERLALERERARLERICAPKERTEEVTEDGNNDSDTDIVDRKERFLIMFEKLVENF